jgi:hypothetical protein
MQIYTYCVRTLCEIHADETTKKLSFGPRPSPGGLHRASAMEFAPAGFNEGNRAIETTYVRPIISKFGGIIHQGTAVAIPPQNPGAAP